VVFSSIVFLFYFLPVFLLGYYLSGWRTGVLLLGSVLFYTWGEGAYVLIAGPIVRYADIRAEMHADRRGHGTIALGLQYLIVGLCAADLPPGSVAPD
jgi:hypothetical protein